MWLIFLALYSWIWIFQKQFVLKYNDYLEEKHVWLNHELNYPRFENRLFFTWEKMTDKPWCIIYFCVLMLPQTCSLKPHTFLTSQFCGSGVGHGLAGSSPSRSHMATFKMWALRLQSHLKLNWGSSFFQVLMVIGSIRFPKGFQIESQYFIGFWLAPCQVGLPNMAKKLL